jgi:hypothetical protein
VNFASVPSAWNPPTRLRTTRAEEDQMNKGTRDADRAQEAGIEAFDDEPAVDRSHGEQGDRGDRSNQVKSRIVECQHRSEQDGLCG